MIDVEETDAGLRAVDIAKNEVEIEIEDWEPGGEAVEIDRDVDVTLAGTASELRLPVHALTVESAGRERLRWVHFGDQLFIHPGEHLIQADMDTSLYIHLNSKFEIFSDMGEKKLIISPPETTSFTIGFRSHLVIPRRVLRFPPTLDGLASALSTFGGIHKTDTPDRSYPSMRTHPPLLEVDDGATIDEEITDCIDSSIVLRLPRSLESLFVAAPFVYYLGATVELVILRSW